MSNHVHSRDRKSWRGVTCACTVTNYHKNCTLVNGMDHVDFGHETEADVGSIIKPTVWDIERSTRCWTATSFPA